jgi:outer membrane biosynthesis protein TonB
MNLSSNATLDATAICNDIAEMAMPVSTRKHPEGSLSALFEGIEPARTTLESTPAKPAKKPAKKGVAKKAPKASKPTPAPKAEKPVAKAEPETKPAKKPKTILEGGLTYSLLSRVRNAFPADMRSDIESEAEVLELVDGRGTEQTISEAYLVFAIELGGAKYLSSVRSSHVKRELKARGIIGIKKGE